MAIMRSIEAENAEKVSAKGRMVNTRQDITISMEGVLKSTLIHWLRHEIGWQMQSTMIGMT